MTENKKDRHKELKYCGLSLLQLMVVIGVAGVILTLVLQHFAG